MLTTDTNDLAKIKDWINQVYAQACVEVEFFESSATGSALSANASNQTIPTAIANLDYIIATRTDGTKTLPLREVPFEEILRRRANSGAQAGTSGAPSHYAVYYTAIEFWPNANGGETFTYYGEALPTALSANGDLPVIPEPYASKVLEYGACAEAADFKKDPDVQTYRALHEDWMRRLRSYKNKRRGKQVQALGLVGSALFPPHDPSVDIR